MHSGTRQGTHKALHQVNPATQQCADDGHLCRHVQDDLEDALFAVLFLIGLLARVVAVGGAAVPRVLLALVQDRSSIMRLDVLPSPIA